MGKFGKEMDTYKVGTTANSTSTMHKLSSTPISMDCFEMDDFDGGLCVDTSQQYENGYISNWHVDSFWNVLIFKLEELRIAHNAETDPERKKKLWKELVRLLPESWLQTRTWTADYEVLRNIYHQRRNHKLVEWRKFCEWVESLPYSELITSE